MHHRYAYQLSPRMIRSVLFLGVPIVLFSAYAIDSGLGIGVADLPVSVARLLYALLAAVGLAILGWGAWMLKIGVRCVEIESDGITVPASMMSERMIKIAFGNIQQLDVTEYSGAQMLHITHSDGKCKLESPHFESLDAFIDLEDKLYRAVPHAG